MNVDEFNLRLGEYKNIGLDIYIFEDGLRIHRDYFIEKLRINDCRKHKPKKSKSLLYDLTNPKFIEFFECLEKIILIGESRIYEYDYR